MKIKANVLKGWIEEELQYAGNPERAVVSYRERLFLGGYRELEEKEVKVDAEAIAEALNRHGNESVDLGKVQSYHFDNEGKFIWTVRFSVYV